ncbi:hypothetical protein L873DRAFT_1817174 [Choiromyces venosus 120613-1]|uniref:Uncharacterized protein n=1 Tax=Choiromyces venosus 120613-1 TaxID=1336337 RepID=A0A3N4J3N8_9PEZI|nr:hypothetical protein L873DRAFT_1817174 [Choiromyces venosus 120613-1]
MNSRVNRPVDPKQRDRDVENKLRLYGIYSGFQNGKLPSNKQIDVALSSLTNHSKLRSPNQNLSAESKVILEDFRTVVEEAKRLLLVKNHDEVLQEFIWNTTQLAVKGGPQTSTPGVPVSKETASRDAEQAQAGFRTLGQLIIANSQFRKLLNDAVILLRDIAGDAAIKSASRINPTEEQLRQMDNPAPDHQWHDAPNLTRENFKNQVRDQFSQNKPVSHGDVRETVGNATQAADPSDSRDPRDPAVQTTNDQQYGTASGVDASRGVRAGAEELHRGAEEDVPEEQKRRVRKYRERTSNYMRNKMPQERREQVIFRLKKMIVEIQSHQDYQEAIDTLLRLAETYTGHTKGIARDSSGTAKEARQDNHLQSAEKSLKVILERFANYTSTEDLVDSINDIYRDADNDPELKDWFRAVNNYIRTCLKEEGYILRHESNEQYDRLYDHGNFLLRNRYRDHTDRIANEFRFLGEQFAADPENQCFGQAMQKLFNDLGNDENGKPVFKKHLVKDITQIIIPELFESVRYIPLPRIEYSDRIIDAVVENFIIESDNLMPNVLEIGSDNYFRFGRKTISSKSSHTAMVSASQIQCDLRDVSYYIKKKQGFPSITDTGVADIFLGGDGFNFKLQLATASKLDRARFFKVERVDVNMSTLKIKLKQSNHKTLFAIFKPILMGIMKPAITKVLEKQIRDTFGRLDQLAYAIYQEEQKIEQNIKKNPDPENVQNIYRRYYQAAQRELANRKKKAEAKVADKHANIAVTKHDSMFKNISLPGGISTKATEYKDLSRRGDRWGSEVFNIGSASPTSSPSKDQQITRKSPHAHHRTTRGRETTSVGGVSRDSGYHANDYHGYGTGTGNTGFGDKLADGQHDSVGNRKIGEYTLNQPLDENYATNYSGATPVA